ncbi:MAG: DinB family protein [Ktedonobacteraceae bacterium]
MADLPSFAMHVSDVSASSAFLVDMLNFTLNEHRPDADLAYLLDPNEGDVILLAGPAVHDLSALLAAEHYIAKRGDSISIEGNLEAQQAELLSKGITDFQIKQSRTGDRTLALPAFDNYTFLYTETAAHTFDELLHLYARSSAELDETLVGLSEEETRLALHEDSWSIRQIVHHLADCEMLFAQIMKVQLSSPGTVMAHPHAIGNANVDAGLEYRERPVASSVALFRAFHEHILDIVTYVPNAG